MEKRPPKKEDWIKIKRQVLNNSGNKTNLQALGSQVLTFFFFGGGGIYTVAGSSKKLLGKKASQSVDF